MVQIEEVFKENSVTDTTKSPPKSRSERMAQERDKYEPITHYLRHGKNQEGLTKNQQRIVRRQAKSYFFEETSKILKSVCFAIN
jgi:hypothetical protein